MKKIKIITFQNAHNYGATLQTYALQKFLRDNKYDTEDINYKNQVIENQYKIVKINKSNFLSFSKSVVVSIIQFVPNCIRYRKFEKFIKKNIKLSKVYKSEKEIINNPPDADVYITGSDQVWNTIITDGLRKSYTLNFGKNEINRISYAASIGNPIIYDYEKNFYKEKISKINHISVREKIAKDNLEKIGLKDVKVCIDPTLLLDKKIWNNLIENKKAIKQDYIFAYEVKPEQEYYDIVNIFSNENNLGVVHFERKGKKYNKVIKNAYTAGPIEFLTLIKNSKYVICTSFHATVFSIIFHKDFYVIPHKETGNRVTNLLKLLNINGRVFYNYEEFVKRDREDKIDWNKVDKKLEDLKRDSAEWLINAIESEK